jgi:hypothetical protein
VGPEGVQADFRVWPLTVLNDPRWPAWAGMATQYGRPEAEAA